MFRGFARGDDADNVAIIALTVADEEEVGSGAHSEHEKTLLCRGMRLVIELNSELVVENGLGFLKGNTMFPEIRCGFGRIPLKGNHLYIVWMTEYLASP